MKIAVCGSGGMIGGHLVKQLLAQGHEVLATDIKPLDEWWQLHEGAANRGRCNLRNANLALYATRHCEQVYDLAENMGGIGFITNNKVDCAESIEIGISLLRAAVKNNVERFFFSSSACVYPAHLQSRSTLPKFSTPSDLFTPAAFNPSLKETDAWPADPEEGYGLSKLYMEELCRYYTAEHGLETRVARYHNVFGPFGSWNDGREKAPAAICRKVAEAKRSGYPFIHVWGDGRQLRSYLHVDDCVRASIALMESDCSYAVNIGSDFSVDVNGLISLVEYIADIKPRDRLYEPQEAQGVDGRNADINLAKEVLHWEPQLTLENGLRDLYRWIEEQVKNASLHEGSESLGTTTEEPA